MNKTKSGVSRRERATTSNAAGSPLVALSRAIQWHQGRGQVSEAEEPREALSCAHWESFGLCPARSLMLTLFGSC